MAAAARNDADQILPVFLELGALEWIDLVTDYTNNHRSCPFVVSALIAAALVWPQRASAAPIAAMLASAPRRLSAVANGSSSDECSCGCFGSSIFLVGEPSGDNAEQLSRVCAAFDNDASVAVEVWMWNDL
jgi:hypothetical protein